MSLVGTGDMPSADGEDRTYLWLTLGVLVLILVVGALAYLVWRSSGEMSAYVASLGLPAAGATRAVLP